jgi:hypothetical protein
MHDTDADDMGDLVQASASESLPTCAREHVRSATEQARFISGDFGWSSSGDAIGGMGDAVALYVEDLAAALTELSWISPAGIHWERIPFGEDEAAEALRVVQRTHGWDV